MYTDETLLKMMYISIEYFNKLDYRLWAGNDL